MTVTCFGLLKLYTYKPNTMYLGILQKNLTSNLVLFLTLIPYIYLLSSKVHFCARFFILTTMGPPCESNGYFSYNRVDGLTDYSQQIKFQVFCLILTHLFQICIPYIAKF